VSFEAKALRAVSSIEDPSPTYAAQRLKTARMWSAAAAPPLRYMTKSGGVAAALRNQRL